MWQLLNWILAPTIGAMFFLKWFILSLLILCIGALFMCVRYILWYSIGRFPDKPSKPYNYKPGELWDPPPHWKNWKKT